MTASPLEGLLPKAPSECGVFAGFISMRSATLATFHLFPSQLVGGEVRVRSTRLHGLYTSPLISLKGIVEAHGDHIMSQRAAVPDAWDDDWESLADVRIAICLPIYVKANVFAEAGVERYSARSCTKIDQVREASAAPAIAERSLGFSGEP